MTIPKHNELFSNVLSLFSDTNEEYHTRDVKRIVADLLNLSPEERLQSNRRDNEPLIEYNLGWTLTYLKKAGLLESKRRGYVNITELGLKEIKNNPNLSEKDLNKFPEFVEFKKHSNRSNNNDKQLKLENGTLNYQEEINNVFTQINSEISNDLIKKINKKTFSEITKFILNLLKKMDYNELNIVNKDNFYFNGIINQDEFGLNKIGIHTVKTFDEVKVSELQTFAGFLVSNGLSNGIFFTTSSFSINTEEYIKNQVNLNIVLVDCKRLSELMMKYGLGVKTIETYELKAIDNDYFKGD